MFTTKTCTRFQFKNNVFIHYYISIIITYQTAFKENFNLLLNFTQKTSPLQFLKKCILIHSLQEPITQSIINIIKCFDYPIRFFFI